MKTAAAIIVGYTLKARKDAEDVMPEFTAPSNYGQEKAVEYIRNKKEAWRSGGSARSPYSGTIDKAVLVALPTLGELQTNDRLTDVQKDFDNAADIARYINQRYTSLFDFNGESVGGPVRVIGFDPRSFLKILALEAAEKNVPLPHELWYAAEYRDIENAVCPEKTDATLQQALKRLVPDEELHAFTPGFDPIKDAKIATQLALKLHLLPAWNKELMGALQVLSGAAPTQRAPITKPLLASATSAPGLDPTKPRKKVSKPLV